MDDSKKVGRIEIESARTLVKECFRNIEDAYCHKKSVCSISTYSQGLDSLLMGLHKSDLIVVTGRPGVGKSAFIHNIIVNTAMEGVRSLLFSPEMSKQMVSIRLLSVESCVPYYNIDCAKLEEDYWPQLTTAAWRLSESGLNIDDALPLHMSRIIEVANEMKRNNKLDLLVIDSLPFISADDNESKDVSGVIAMALKCLARELDIPVLLTVPLKAVSLESASQRPCLTDIGDESLVKYADTIILLHKTMLPDVIKFHHKKMPPQKVKEKIEAIIEINRNGKQGIVSFYFFDSIMGFKFCVAQEQTALDMK